jgi:hypothetical protein
LPLHCATHERLAVGTRRVRAPEIDAQSGGSCRLDAHRLRAGMPREPAFRRENARVRNFGAAHTCSRRQRRPAIRTSRCWDGKEADESRPTRSEAQPSEGRQPERERLASATARRS